MKKYVWDPLRGLWRQPSFVVCTIVMAVCAAGLHVGADMLKLYFRKEPLPLKKPLDELAESSLLPWRVTKKETISKEIIPELGTSEYITWRLEDQNAAKDDPFREVSLFITYYTGDPDKVPHVPDECYLASGATVKGKDNLTVTVLDIGAEKDQLPVRLLDLSLPTNSGLGEEIRTTVSYFFAVNGTYRCTRDEVRLLQNNIYDRYAYFSKIEVFFLGAQNPSQSEVLKHLEALFQKLVPVLVEDHFPDWAAAQKDQK